MVKPLFITVVVLSSIAVVVDARPSGGFPGASSQLAGEAIALHI